MFYLKGFTMCNINRVLSIGFAVITLAGAPLFSEITNPEVKSSTEAQKTQSLLSNQQVDKLVDTVFANTQTSKTDESAKEVLKQKLKKYKITGMTNGSGWINCWDANAAFIYDNQNPSFDVTFKDAYGNVKIQTFQASIKSVGFKFGLSFKFNTIFFTDSSIDYLHTMKEIKLGTGVDISIGAYFLNQCLTYVPFLNAPGGMIIIGTSLGIQSPLEASIVIGGSLKPECEDQEANN